MVFSAGASGPPIRFPAAFSLALFRDDGCVRHCRPGGELTYTTLALTPVESLHRAKASRTHPGLGSDQREYAVAVSAGWQSSPPSHLTTVERSIREVGPRGMH